MWGYNLFSDWLLAFKPLPSQQTAKLGLSQGKQHGQRLLHTLKTHHRARCSTIPSQLSIVSILQYQNAWAKAVSPRDGQEDCQGSLKLQREQER